MKLTSPLKGFVQLALGVLGGLPLEGFVQLLYIVGARGSVVRGVPGKGSCIELRLCKRIAFR